MKTEATNLLKKLAWCGCANKFENGNDPEGNRVKLVSPPIFIFWGGGGCAMEQILGEIYIFSLRYLDGWGFQRLNRTQMNIQTQLGELFRTYSARTPFSATQKFKSYFCYSPATVPHLGV